ncbi:MAG: ATP-binding cassette domain-containing protein [Proteobacteria bacterium]|nr:ATP-binding cassette domain-containing protein [Pseudomonadota bacterium]
MSFVQSTTAPVAALTGPVGRLLMPLLEALDNDRAKAVLASAVPDPRTPLTPGLLAVTLGRLGYDVAQGRRAAERWRQPLDGAVVAIDRAGTPGAFAKIAGRVMRLSPDGAAVSVDPGEAARALAQAARVIHVRRVFAVPLTEFDENLRRVLAAGFGVSLVVNLVALAVPFLTMVIYDRVIGGAATDILPGLAIGGAVALLAVFALRRLRARLLAAAYGRFGFSLQGRVADRVLRAPLAASGRFQAYALLARVREAWRGVDPLSNALSTALFDAPFIVLSLLAVLWVGGAVVLVPVAYLALFFAIALLMERRSRLELQVAGEAMAEREAMLSELAQKAVELRLAGVADAWLRRFEEASRRVAAASLATASRGALSQAVAYVLGTGAALATLAAGVALVFADAMTAGGLIATMLLVWRITAPAQALFFSLGRLRQAGDQRTRLEALLQAPVEADRAVRLHKAHRTVPSLHFERVSYRPPGAAETIVTGLSFAVEPGEVVAVIGPTGSGKTTVLQLAAGLLSPSLGLVAVDGQNLLHIDPDDYRLTVASLWPARPHVFDASLRDNIALAAPWMDERMGEAVVRAAWGADAGRLAADLSQPASAAAAAPLADDSAARLGLARLLAKPPRIAVLDSPFDGAAPDLRVAVESFIAAARGTTSILFAAADPAMARLADKVLVLNAGSAAYFGPPAPPPASPQPGR